MNEIKIEKVASSELEELQNIGRRTFETAFADQNTKADMEDYLAKSFSREKIQSELDNPNSAFFFAKIEEQTIGYLKLNFGIAQTEMKTANRVEIERIYVLQSFQGKKIGQTLYEKAVEIAKNRSATHIWLGVWEKNLRAIRFYERNGFVAFDKHVFFLGKDKQMDIMMELKL